MRHLIDAHVEAVGWKTSIVPMGHEASGAVWIRRLHHTGGFLIDQVPLLTTLVVDTPSCDVSGRWFHEVVIKSGLER
ncbi:hypothetical protein ACTMTI_30555 [Nonomuraea sp. H19]|uniref:hypothetical protein n=1 Tax=Nonomuraea sp. H19 TaxID=3452206 RepID=UPI003F88F532